MDLLKNTRALRDVVEALKVLFEQTEEVIDKKNRDHFLKVKQETKAYYDRLDIWEEQALQAVKDREVNVHPHQVSSTRDNVELFIMHSYYVDVKQKRYMEIHRSIIYILDQMIRELE